MSEASTSCSLCGAPGVNKVTCPLNPQCATPKPLKHNVKVKGKGKASGTTELTKIKVTAKPKTVHVPLPAAGLQQPTPVASASAFQPPPLAFPNDRRAQQEFEADWIRLMLPPVPKTHEPISAELTDACQTCHKLIRWNPVTPQDKTKRWINIHSICDKCANLIGSQYQRDAVKSRYKQYHKSGTNPTLDEIIAHGGKESFYNATMHDGARFWSGIAIQRAMPSVPK